MPSDITGTEVIYQDPATNERQFKFLPGPDFCQRDSGRRNQPHPAEDPGGHARGDAGAARHGRRDEYKLPDPFFVLATQNPVEQEGTYPLPEAQLDRFMFMIFVDYPTPRRRAAGREARHRRSAGAGEAVLGAEHILYCRMPSGGCRWPTT